jgi:YesN/AraC family two-component response regulator
MENPSPIILTDIVMPEMEGIQTIVEFRRTYPGVKIIAVSGGGRISPDQYLLMATKLGAHRVFSKPFKTSELLAAVEELLAE